MSSAQSETKEGFMGYQHCQDQRQPKGQRAPLDRDMDPQENRRNNQKTDPKPIQTGSVCPKKSFLPMIPKPTALSP